MDDADGDLDADGDGADGFPALAAAKDGGTFVVVDHGSAATDPAAAADHLQADRVEGLVLPPGVLLVGAARTRQISATATVFRSSNVAHEGDEPHRKTNGEMNARTGHDGTPGATRSGVHLTLVR
ncbi:hypothetical protein [Streptosporangium saharense]|uniref:hypothetical protein n=1 Tax=Streptosporangium saharense TaxID=1706840 RepID=UPI00331A0238